MQFRQYTLVVKSSGRDRVALLVEGSSADELLYSASAPDYATQAESVLRVRL